MLKGAEVFERDCLKLHPAAWSAGAGAGAMMAHTNETADPWASRWMLMAAGIFLAGSIAYLSITLIRQPLAISDFRYIWVAGDVWAHNGNPYGPDYSAVGQRYFPTKLYPVLSWVYPFHWYLPARFAASFDPAQGFAIWLALSTALLAAAGWFAWAAARTTGATWPIAGLVAVTAYACGSSALTFLLRHGQPSALAVAGVAVTMVGVAKRRRSLMAIGVTLALLKPHLGVPVVFALLFMPRGLAAVIAGGVLTALLSIPALVAGGLRPQLIGLIEQSTGNYQDVSFNAPGVMSGMPHLIYLASGRSIPLTISMLAAALLAAGAIGWTRRLEIDRRTALFIALSCSVTATVVSLHGYDLAILLLPLPLLPLLGRRELVVAGAGYALLWRPENLARLLGNFWYFPTLQSLAAAFIALAWLLTARRWLAATPGEIDGHPKALI